LRALPPPDEILLRRFGVVRAVGGGGYFVAVAICFAIFGSRVWPLALGVPVLAVVTTGYFVRSTTYPRTSVVASLAADALVLGGAIAFLGGTGSGLVMLYSIVVVSAGILLGPGVAAGFTGFSVVLGLVQLLVEQLGYPPVLLHRPELSDRLPILLVSFAGLLSVGYLTATYASRLHELVAEAGEQVEAHRRLGRRRRSFLARAAVDVREPLRALEALADGLDERTSPMDEQERRTLASKLRMSVTTLDAELSQLADVGAMDEADDRRPEPVLLQRVVHDCIVALGDRLAGYQLDVDVPVIKVLGDRRAARRIVFNLLENVVEHTPPGTAVAVRAVAGSGAAVLAVSDNGPGIAQATAARLFAAPDQRGRRSDEPAAKVGLPLSAEIAASMGAEIRYEPAPGGGSRFLVKFRMAPTGAPSADDADPATRVGSAPDSSGARTGPDPQPSL
jgi:two-component system, OmpR family, sensor kinase